MALGEARAAVQGTSRAMKMESFATLPHLTAIHGGLPWQS